LTSLLGRETELAETERLIEKTRLLTLTGAGGSGKTRLAVELARRLADRFEDVIWVDLAPIADPDLIAAQLLAALGLREVPEVDDVEVLLEALRSRHALLVLDNCEHLIDASASTVEAILRRCPGVTILTTTREALGIGGEQTWLVPPLAEKDAMQLFAERAHAVAPAFALSGENDAAVARVCNRLDGIPLAIELAAARVKVMSVEQIAERLADAFRLLSSGSRTLPRHRTIRETIDWSFRLLSEEAPLPAADERGRAADAPERARHQPHGPSRDHDSAPRLGCGCGAGNALACSCCCSSRPVPRGGVPPHSRPLPKPRSAMTPPRRVPWPSPSSSSRRAATARPTRSSPPRPIS
jgi:hypothetical protein